MRSRVLAALFGTILVGILTAALLRAQVLPRSASTPGTSTSAGRYQLINLPTGDFLIDTSSGRVWRNTQLTQDSKPVDPNPCGIGLINCFLEVDRMKLTATGWKSELR